MDTGIYNAIDHFINNGEDSGLMLMQMPTGTGKTENVLHIIHDLAVNTDFKKNIVFITPLKKNIPWSKIKGIFHANDQDELFKEIVANVYPTAPYAFEKIDSVQKIIHNDFAASPEWQDMVAFTSRLNKNEKLSYNSLNSDEKDIFDKKEKTFREYISKTMKKEFPTLDERENALLNNDRWRWLCELYPSSLSWKKKVFFMSLDKFLLINNTIIDHDYSFLYSPMMEGAIIFMDEFDSCKDTMLNRIIEDALKPKIDFIDLFRVIRNALNNRQLEKSLLTPSTTLAQSNRNDKDLEGNIVKVTAMANACYERNHLEYSIVRSEEMRKEGSSLLFNDGINLNVLAKGKKAITITLDEKNGRNIMNTVSDYPESGITSLPRFLGEIRGIISYFCGAVARIADNHIMKQKELKNPETLAREQMIRSIISNYTTDEKYLNYLTESILKAQTRTRGKNTGNDDFSFFNNGFAHYSVKDSDTIGLNTKLDIWNMNVTPEKILADLASRSKIIGISATATIPSSIGNFYLDYLKSRLDTSFWQPSEEDRKRMHSDFQQLTAGYDGNVEIHCSLIESSTNFTRKEWRKLFPESSKSIADIMGREVEANIYYPEDEDKDASYLHARIFRIASAWKEFILHEDINSLLAVLTTFPREGKPTLDSKTLYDVMDAIAEEYGKNLRAADNVVILEGTSFEDTKNDITLRLSKGEKLFVISCYQTVGAGQNLQHRIPKGMIGKLVKVNEWGNKEKDFDAIYLDRPTNMLANINGGKDENAINKLLFHIGYLTYGYDISFKQNRQYIKQALKSWYSNGTTDFVINHEAESIKYYGTRLIIQAIGRICRTGYKNPDIYIFADAGLRETISTNLPMNELYNKEFLALLNELNKMPQKDRNQEKWQIEADTRNKLCRNEINNIRPYGYKGTTYRWSRENISRWNRLRDQVLKHPVMTSSDEPSMLQFNWYMKLPFESNKYWFNEDNDFYNITISTEKNHDNLYEMSAEKARLTVAMSIPEIREYFNKEGYATSFASGSYMMPPVVFNNIYKGALGEQVGRFILEHYSEIILNEIKDPYEFELFDNISADGSTYIDFKNWSDTREVDFNEAIVKIESKASLCKAKKIVLVNLAADERMKIQKSETDSGLTILQVPYLINTTDLTVSREMTEKIKEFING